MNKKNIFFIVSIVLVLSCIYLFLNYKDPNIKYNNVMNDPNKKLILEEKSTKNTSSLNQEISRPVNANPVKILSADAKAAYMRVLDNGWSTIVDDFEKNSFKNSTMSDDEINKLCDLAIVNVSETDLKRLLKTDCRPTGKYTSNLIINSKIRDKDGNLDENEIIQKLQLLNKEGLLSLKNTYDQNLKEDKFGKIEISLFDKAVSLGANNVIDYVVSIGSSPTSNRNPIFTQVAGRPNLTTVKKLLKMGYTADQSTLTYINNNDFQNKYPEIYSLLNK